MDVLNKNFESAIQIVNNLKQKPSNEDLLIIYGLFKQAKFGDNNEPQPGFLDFKGYKKWEAWNKNKGITEDEAKQNYINKAMELFKTHGQ